MKILNIVSFICLCFIGCSNNSNRLPILGTLKLIGNEKVYPTIPAFEFVNQDSILITDKTFDNKIYIADFIFLSCPTICPKMTAEMQKIYETFNTNPNILYLSHTIDPFNDSVSKLKSYSNNLKADPKKWFFVTGDRDKIFAIAQNGYFSTAYSDSSAPGGYVHSAGLLLIDKFKHIRGVYDGINPVETGRLKSDINMLLNEQF